MKLEDSLRLLNDIDTLSIEQPRYRILFEMMYKGIMVDYRLEPNEMKANWLKYQLDKLEEQDTRQYKLCFE